MEILLKHRDRIRPWKPDGVLTRTLAFLVQVRGQAVDGRTRLTSRLTALLKGYFPQTLDWVGEDLYSHMACDFLNRWLMLYAVQRVSAAKLRAFYHGHHARRKDLIDQRIEQIGTAHPLTSDRVFIDSSVVAVKMMVDQLRILQDAISVYDKKIHEIHAQHPDRDIFSTLPGAGDQLAPRILAAFGDDRDNYQSSEEFQSFVGTAPVTESSGKSTRVHWRWAVPTFLRQTFHEHALHSIAKTGGLQPTISSRGIKEKADMPPCASSLLSGSESSIDAGKIEPRTTRNDTSSLFRPGDLSSFPHPTTITSGSHML